MATSPMTAQMASRYRTLTSIRLLNSHGSSIFLREPPCIQFVTQKCRYATYDQNDLQAHPLQGYYAEMLSNPLSKIQPLTRTAPEPPPKEHLPLTEKEERLAKARVVFGSRLAGPAERRDEIRQKSIEVAGVLVPPKPIQPDNCCMSGCVNCVWDRYRDELEEWVAANTKARRSLAAQKKSGTATAGAEKLPGTPQHIMSSMDDDGGGSESNWESASSQDIDLFKDIPIGIREFMRTEKLLKQKRLNTG